MHLLNDAISSEWIQPYGLKHLFTSLYNIGVILYRNKQLEEVSLHWLINFMICILQVLGWSVYFPVFDIA